MTDDRYYSDWQTQAEASQQRAEVRSSRFQELIDIYGVQAGSPLRLPALDAVEDAALHEELVSAIRNQLEQLSNPELAEISAATAQDRRQLRHQRGQEDWLQLEAGLQMLRSVSRSRGQRSGLPCGRRTDPEMTARMALTEALKRIFWSHLLAAARIVNRIEGCRPEDVETLVTEIKTNPQAFGRIRPEAIRLGDYLADHVERYLRALGLVVPGAPSIGGDSQRPGRPGQGDRAS